jgi:purine-binding chemotaxis protein CheW
MTGKVLTFYLRGSLFGIDIKLIKEINRNVEFTPVPGARPYILGLFNMRGQIVTIFDLSQMIGISDEICKESSTCIILKPTVIAQNHVGFLIDKPGDVIDISEDNSELPPANVSNIESEYIKNVVMLDDRLLIIMDPEKIFKV